MTPIEQAEAARRRYERTYVAGNDAGFGVYQALNALLAEHKRVLAEMHQRELHHFETERMLTEAGIDVDAVQGSAKLSQNSADVRSRVARLLCEADDMGTFTEDEGTCAWHLRLADDLLSRFTITEKEEA